MTAQERLYGGSLYELAAEEGLTEEMMEQSALIRKLFAENPEYVSLLTEPSIPKAEREGLIDEAFGGMEKYLVNFIKLLCDRGMIRSFAGCCDEYTRRYDQAHNIAQAVVTTAVALDDKQLAALKEKLEKISGKSIRVKTVTDPSLIAGIKVELDGKLMDGTVKGRLEGISRNLKEINV